MSYWLKICTSSITKLINKIVLNIGKKFKDNGQDNKVEIFIKFRGIIKENINIEESDKNNNRW